MKSMPVVVGFFALVVVCVAGCGTHSSLPRPAESDIVAEGIIFTVEYELLGGGAGGFTRINRAVGMPGGKASWNVDAYGQLTNDYLIITYPQQKDFGSRIIPARRLVGIQFGDGGIKNIDESRLNSAGYSDLQSRIHNKIANN